MALTNELGLIPMVQDHFASNGSTPGYFATGVIDASGEKLAFIGGVWHPTVKTGTIAIRKVHFRCAAITLNAASEVRVSLQNISLTAGPPYQPDGTQDQTYDFKTATTALTANAWNNTGNLSADRTVSLSADSSGDANSRRLAVVFEFQAFNASDSVIFSMLARAHDAYGFSGNVLNTGSWAAIAAGMPIVALECDDGTFAFMHQATVWSALNNVSVASNGAIRRAGVKFKVPTARSIDRASMSIRLVNGADGALVLYDSDGTTVLRSVDVDNDEALVATNAYYYEVSFEPVALLANTFYRWAFVSSTTTAALCFYGDVNAAALMDGLVLGQSAHWTQHDGSVWTDTTTRRPGFGLGWSAFDDGLSGLKIHPGMRGGLNG